jgi:hypothetical protein
MPYVDPPPGYSDWKRLQVHMDEVYLAQEYRQWALMILDVDGLGAALNYIEAILARKNELPSSA